MGLFKHRIPSFSLWLLKQLNIFTMEEGYSGDVVEEYYIVQENYGLIRANIWLSLQAIRSLPDFIKSYILWSGAMIKNYIKIAFRNMKRHKGYSFISILGLTIGMTVFILIMLFVRNEVGYDRFHENFTHIYRIVSGDPSDKNSYAGTMAPLGPVLLDNIPSIENMVRLSRTEAVLHYKERAFNERRIFLADPSIFDVFSFPLIEGDPDVVLRDKNAIVLTESMADKFFGSENPLGKVLRMNDKEDLVVTGVAANVPVNSHFHFDCLMRFDRLERYLDSWGTWNFYTYLLLNKTESPKLLKSQIEGWAKEYMPEGIEISKRLHYQPLSQIHFQYNRKNIEPAFNGTYIQVFITVAVVVLILACINFMNLTTARSFERTREIGIKKTLGGYRFQLIKQFIGESILLALCANLVAWILVQLSLPWYNHLIGRKLTLNILDPVFLLGMLGLILFTGILSGAYPAFVLSSLHPSRVLKGESSPEKRSVLRNGLVIFQFTISVALIICTMIIFEQMRYIQRMDLGFNKEHVINVRLNRGLRRDASVLKDVFMKVPGVLSTSLNGYVPSNMNWHQSVWWRGLPDNEYPMMWYMSVDKDFMETLQIPMIEGEDLPHRFKPSGQDAFVLNASAIKQIGWDSALGKEFGFGEQRPGRVVGVVQDFHFRSLHHEVASCVMWIRETGSQISVRIQSKDIRDSMQLLKETWQTHVPNFPFDYYFLDDDFDSLYKSETKLSQLIILFTLLSLFIACLGLFSMASFTAVRKTKEIGIRKVLGASVSGITVLLSKSFVLWVLIANVFAWPIAYFAMNRWIQNFTYRIGLALDIFFISGLFSIFIALITVCFQSIKAALANPVNSLRYE